MSNLRKPLQKFRAPAEFRLTRIRETSTSRITVDSPETAVAYWQDHITTAPWFNPLKEHAVVLLLDARLAIGGHLLISVGDITETCASPRQIFGPMLLSTATSLILMHNHPSGDPMPSHGDRCATKQIDDGAKIFGLILRDHIIVGNPGARPYFSFAEEKIMPDDASARIVSFVSSGARKGNPDRSSSRRGLYTTSEVAAFFRVKPSDIIRMTEEDGLPAILLPGKKRPVRKFSATALHRWISERSTGTALPIENFLAELARALA